MFSKKNYWEDGVEFVFFDETKYQRLASNHILIESDLISVLDSLNKRSKIGVGFFSISDISNYLVFNKPLAEYLKQDNIGIMTLPITCFNEKIYCVEDYSFFDFLRIIKTNATFLLYQFKIVKGKIMVRGKKI